MAYITQQVKRTMNKYMRTGPSKSRREELDRMIKFVEWASSQPGVKTLENLGRVHFWKFYEHLERKGLSQRRIYMYSLSISKLWKAMGRPKKAPRPNFQ